MSCEFISTRARHLLLGLGVIAATAGATWLIDPDTLAAAFAILAGVTNTIEIAILLSQLRRPQEDDR